LFAIGGEALLTFFVANELFSKIAVAVTAGYAQISRFEFLHDLREDAQLKTTPHNVLGRFDRLRLWRNQGPPGLADKRQIENGPQRIPFLLGCRER
jgi:hypothetical protein